MKTTKSIAAYAMLLGTLLATNLVQTAHADPCVEVQNVVCGMRKNVLRHEIELAFERGDFRLAFHLIDLLEAGAR